LKYGGSALWAAMIYWLVAGIFTRKPVFLIALFACIATTGIETFKLVYSPGLESFRLTLAGKLLLGRIFSLKDLVAYAVAIALCGALDHSPLKKENLNVSKGNTPL
jgi:hypothetical protein